MSVCQLGTSGRRVGDEAVRAGGGQTARTPLGLPLWSLMVRPALLCFLDDAGLTAQRSHVLMNHFLHAKSLQGTVGGRGQLKQGRSGIVSCTHTAVGGPGCRRGRGGNSTEARPDSTSTWGPRSPRGCMLRPLLVTIK